MYLNLKNRGLKKLLRLTGSEHEAVVVKNVVERLVLDWWPIGGGSVLMTIIDQSRIPVAFSLLRSFPF